MVSNPNYTGCLNCGSMRHYARNLCRNCYLRFLRTDGGIPEFLEKEKEKEKLKAERQQKRKEKEEERMRILATNEFERKPTSPANRAIWDWYYNGEERYLILEFDSKKEALNAYQGVYAMTRRRHNMNIKRYINNDRIVVERLNYQAG